MGYFGVSMIWAPVLSDDAIQFISHRPMYCLLQTSFSHFQPGHSCKFITAQNSKSWFKGLPRPVPVSQNYPATHNTLVLPQYASVRYFLRGTDEIWIFRRPPALTAVSVIWSLNSQRQYYCKSPQMCCRR